MVQLQASCTRRGATQVMGLGGDPTGQHDSRSNEKGNPVMSEVSTITVNRTELGNALTFAQLGLSKRPVAPVLAGMLVTVSSGTLELAAFDYDTSARAKVSGQASGPASILVNGADLAVAVKSLPRGKKIMADLSIVPGTTPAGEATTLLVIECEGLQASVSSLPMDEYPQLPKMPELSGYVDAETFARTVARVSVCHAPTVDYLPVLENVSIRSEHGSLEMAATDRYRLAVDRIHWTGPDGITALADAVTLAKFAKTADKSGKIALHFSETHTGLSDGIYSLIVRNMASGDGYGGRAFPKYRSLMPKASDYRTTVLVVAAALESAVTRAGKMTERNMPVHLDMAEDSITVRAMRDGQVVNRQVVPAYLDGNPIEVRYNPAYLASLLAGVQGEALIGLVSDSKPARSPRVTSPQ